MNGQWQPWYNERLDAAAASIQHNFQEPKPRPENRNLKLKKWESMLETELDRSPKDGKFRGSYIMTGLEHASTLPITHLRSITLNEMKVPQLHKRRFLVCQVIEQPIPMIGLHALVTDLNNDLEILSIYNNSLKFEDTKWLSVGTILVIKEPYLKYGSKTENISIRIDNPSDLIFVDETDLDFLKRIGAEKWHVESTKDVERLRKLGNDDFRRGDYASAWKLYDRAIRYGSNSALYLNKSMACLKLGYVHEAYKAAEMALKQNGDKEKALFRMGLAAYGMRDWTTAFEHFQEICKEFPNNKEAIQQLQKTESRLKESQTGKYNLKEMCQDCMNGKLEFDVSDYMGPIKIVDIPGKGRGVVAVKGIKKKTLLAVSKAFAYGCKQDFPGDFLTANLELEEKENAEHEFRILRVVDYLKKNPHQAKEIYSIYGGQIANEDDKEDVPDGLIDVTQIDQLCRLTAFGNKPPENDIPNPFFAAQRDANLVYVLASKFNHSCMANAHRVHYGDLMFLYAVRDIKEGEEITINYESPLNHYEQRKRQIAATWNFECDCKLCELDRRDDELQKRIQLLDDFYEFAKENREEPKEVIAKGKIVLNEMIQLYKNRKEYKTQLLQLLSIIIIACLNNSDPDSACEYLEKWIQNSYDELLFSVGMEHTAMQIADLYAEQEMISGQAPEKARSMIERALAMSLYTSRDHLAIVYPQAAHLFQ